MKELHLRPLIWTAWVPSHCALGRKHIFRCEVSPQIVITITNVHLGEALVLLQILGLERARGTERDHLAHPNFASFLHASSVYTFFEQ